MGVYIAIHVNKLEWAGTTPRNKTHRNVLIHICCSNLRLITCMSTYSNVAQRCGKVHVQDRIAQAIGLF